MMFGDAPLIEQPRMRVSAEAMQEHDSRAEVAPHRAAQPPPRWKLEKQARIRWRILPGLRRRRPRPWELRNEGIDCGLGDLVCGDDADQLTAGHCLSGFDQLSPQHARFSCFE